MSVDIGVFDDDVTADAHKRRVGAQFIQYMIARVI